MLITEGVFKGLRRNGYRVIAMDVPWKYVTWSKKGMGRSPDRHYPTMTIEEIKALPIRDLCHPAGTLLQFWVIDTHVEMSFPIIKDYGFTYKTVGFYWTKTNKDGTPFMGGGHWTRANPEHAMEAYFGDTEQEVERSFLCTMGKPKRISKSVRRWISSPRRRHSEKPDEFYDRCRQLTAGPYLELFARCYRDGWTVWGNEIDDFGNDEEAKALI